VGHRSDVGIRPWSAGDLELLQRLLGDPAMTEHIGGPETPEAIRARHQRYVDPDESVGGVFAVVARADGAARGWVGYWETSWCGEDVWECGWSVLPEFQGQGVATAGTALMIERARKAGTRRFLHAFPSTANKPSNALCRALGFALLGEVDVEYPPGSVMHANDWCLDLLGDEATGRHHVPERRASRQGPTPSGDRSPSPGSCNAARLRPTAGSTALPGALKALGRG
jgi:RimJ/RimL family protein N-acetyltransferase